MVFRLLVIPNLWEDEKDEVVGMSANMHYTSLQPSEACRGMWITFGCVYNNTQWILVHFCGCPE